MKKLSAFRVLSTGLVGFLFSAATPAAQFPVLDPGYTQEIYTGPLVGGPGMAWTTAGNLLTRNGADILEYSPTQNNVHLGTPVHDSILTHTVTGLPAAGPGSGYGMSRGLDGYIYTPTGAGLYRFNPANWAAPAQALAGTAGGAGYGVTTLPDGRIAYSDGVFPSKVYVYDPVATTNTQIYSASYLIDDIEAGPGGVIALAGQSNSSIEIISNTGSVINSFATAHYPDGFGFGNGVTTTELYANNNDGTITRYTFGAGFLGAPVAADIATGSGAYGDLASVGPDCAFYVSQFENGALHGATPGTGTNWDNGTTNKEPSIIRIAGVASDGTPICRFGAAVNPSGDPTIPLPAAVYPASIGLGLIAYFRHRRSNRAKA